MLRAILACDALGGIARNGVMPWPHNRQDLQHFKQLTSGHTVVMGRRTWEAPDMPTPLPKRTNIVVTRDPSYSAEGATVIHTDTTDHLTNLAKSNTVYVIGGAELVVSLLDHISILHLTRISGNYDCDTFLPLDRIQAQFMCIDRVTVDSMTVFETYLARKLHDLPVQTEL